MVDGRIITEIILESATAAFLKKGYLKTNLRDIAKNAGLTTGALYARFPNKDALFSALVEDVAMQFIELNEKSKNLNVDLNNGLDLKNGMMARIEVVSRLILDHIYDNRTAFKLLINCSTGSSYENFPERVIKIEEKSVLKLLDYLRDQNWPMLNVSNEVAHILVSAHNHALFEVVRHDIPKEEARKQINQIFMFFASGWEKLLGL